MASFQYLGSDASSQQNVKNVVMKHLTRIADPKCIPRDFEQVFCRRFWEKSSGGKIIS